MARINGKTPLRRTPSKPTVRVQNGLFAGGRAIAGIDLATPRAAWLLDVALRLGRAGLPTGHQHEPLELSDEHSVLVEHPGVHLHGAAIGLGLRLLLLEHLGLAEERVAVENGGRVLELFRGQVRDRLPAHVAHRHPQRERIDERANDDIAPLLGFGRVHVVDVERVVVHGYQAEEMIVGLRHRLGGPVLVHGADLELLEIAPVGVRAARLARGLVGLDGLGLGHGSPWLISRPTLDTRAPSAAPRRYGSWSRRHRRPTCETPAISTSPSRSTPPSRRARSRSSPPA